MTARLDTIAIALVQSFAFLVAALSGERWAILPAVVSVAAFCAVLWPARRARSVECSTERTDGYRAQAQRADDATVEVPSPRPARKRVLREAYEIANDASPALCAGAASLGGLGAAFGSLAWYLRAGWPLPLCGGFTLTGFALLGWWSHCRSTVRAWRDQERERGER